MKKAILTIGLFSMMLVLTSFTTPSDFNDTFNSSNTSQYSVILPTQSVEKLDNEPGTVSPTVKTKKLDFEPGTVSPTVKTKKLD